ncbi:MAG: 1-acyl-sn-glycerol-3-phosphate acyltransferase [Bacteroidales bacterium]|jgi:putative hemolysin|nr:glycerol acyltransferase [Lentimicrobiaceae bacterium]MDG1135815.1 1-acyl-sn-glycerol-3-phosphate acyltransferase [Bacteroidales bacterium]MDG1902290.1 1-acyl-sn-glycerol-3-phosphate acyltransferase [Bacteroidales bacterium]MDG2081270.1 1-acyl-sn-glycerol-3-phosphate acyltransferase [Bacteroidales bacterium]|tara:strand:- start:5191 stop:6054 length:864 start_codon:yes stop_codon:yes gene_type:complete
MTESKKNTKLYLDIEKVITDKSPTLKRILPIFIVNYIKRIVHQDKLNKYMDNHKDKIGIDFIEGILGEMNTKLDLNGLENIPKKGRAVIASNHPLGGLDGMALMVAVSKVRGDILFPVNDILMNITNLRPLFMPINKHGGNSSNVKVVDKTFASDSIICYFPFGLVSRKNAGTIEDLFWRPTFITKAIKYKRDIIPTHIDGKNSNFFYNLSNIRKSIGIKANIEMFFLVDELFKQENKTLKITFGPPISYKIFDNRFTMRQWAELIREYSYKVVKGYSMPFEVPKNI